MNDDDDLDKEMSVDEQIEFTNYVAKQATSKMLKFANPMLESIQKNQQLLSQYYQTQNRSVDLIKSISLEDSPRKIQVEMLETQRHIVNALISIKKESIPLVETRLWWTLLAVTGVLTFVVTALMYVAY